MSRKRIFNAENAEGAEEKPRGNSEYSALIVPGSELTGLGRLISLPE
jgi:hypothetical protein